MDLELAAIAARGNIVLRNARRRMPLRDLWAWSGVREHLQLLEIMPDGSTECHCGSPHEVLIRLHRRGITRLDYRGYGDYGPDIDRQGPDAAILVTAIDERGRQKNSVIVWSFEVAGERVYSSDGQLESIHLRDRIAVPNVQTPSLDTASQSLATSLQAMIDMAHMHKVSHAVKSLQLAECVVLGGMRSMWAMMLDYFVAFLPSDGYCRHARRLALGTKLCIQTGVLDNRNWDSHRSRQPDERDARTINALAKACDDALSASIGSFRAT